MYNRYMFVLANPLRYTDPSGNYSEDEIMESFGVDTWDEVLAIFSDENSLYRGRWGWLELLRRAEDGYLVSADAWDCARCNFDEVYAGSHAIIRDGEGRITVGDFDTAMFAHQNYKYTLEKPARGGIFSTDWDTMYLHPTWVDTELTKDDRHTIAMDGVSLVIEGVGALSLFPTGGIGFAIAEVGQFAWDFIGTQGAWNSGKNLTVQRKDNIGFTSDDILGVGGVIPGLGAIVDVTDIVSHATGKKIIWRP